MNPNLAALRRRGRAFVLGVLCLASLAWVDATVITGDRNTKDGAQYERLAVELARSGRFAVGGEATREVEPLHVGLMALQIRFDPRLREILERSDGRANAGLQSKALKQQNLFWGGALLAGVAVQVLLIRRGRGGPFLLAGLAVVSCTVLLLENPDIVDRSLAELPAAALVVWAGVFATRLVRSPSVLHASVLGGVVGLLALTRAIFMFVAIPYAIVLSALLFASQRQFEGTAVAARRASVLLVAAALGLGAIVGPWAFRNAVAFGDAAIAERGSKVLLIRATKNEMDGYQLRGAWVYWAPLPLQSPMARVLDVDLEDFELGRPLVVHARYSEDEAVRDQTFYRRAGAAYDERVADLEAGGQSEAEAIAIAEMEFRDFVIDRMREDPGATLRTSPAFLWRFAWPMNFSTTVPRPLLATINLAGMGLLLLATTLSVLRVRPALFAVVGLPAGATAFYALVTHALPRYARPLAPTMIILLVLGAAALWDRMRPGLRPD